MSLRDFEREEDRAALPRPRALEPDDQERESTDSSPRSQPLGFFLVLSAIVVVAVVYSVTIFAINPVDRTPETVFGAMAAAFTVIGTLVGTYFGIKAGLDGQEKVKDTVSRAIRGGDGRLLGRIRREDE